MAFLSSSYDHTLKVYHSETLTASASFDLDYVIYTHALSPIASHLLVACGTRHPAVRLVDLRTGASTHSLVGHAGAVLALSWSPVDEYILASGATDGTVRFWDVRRSTGSLGVLDMEDSVGILGYDGLGKGARGRQRGRAHDGVVNGIAWTEDGGHVVTTGHDDQVRVWDTAKGANTLASFGPIVKNSHLANLKPIIVPRHLTQPSKDVMILPNDRELLMYELFDAKLLKRLRIQGAPTRSLQVRPIVGQRNVRYRTTAAVWRPHGIQMYSAHTDGTVRSWLPRTEEDALASEEDNLTEPGSELGDIDNQTRKRRALEDIYRDLTRQKLTFR